MRVACEHGRRRSRRSVRLTACLYSATQIPSRLSSENSAVTSSQAELSALIDCLRPTLGHPNNTEELETLCARVKDVEDQGRTVCDAYGDALCTVVSEMVSILCVCLLLHRECPLLRSLIALAYPHSGRRWVFKCSTQRSPFSACTTSRSFPTMWLWRTEVCMSWYRPLLLDPMCVCGYLSVAMC